MSLFAAVAFKVCWGAFALTWLIGALYYQSPASAKQTSTWFASSFLIGIPIVLVVSGVVPMADWRSLTIHTYWVRLPGLVILLAGTAFTLWARISLGVMWSGVPTVKEGHELHTSGPYGVTRHPIYTGILTMLLGSTLLAGGGQWIVTFPVFLILLEIKLHIEERLMLAEFPDAYPRYREQVPQLIPGLCLLRRRTPTRG
jgi:protein-S-isoprenylcysteine O-methyltransferase Ste14